MSLAEEVKVLYGVNPGPLLRRDTPAAVFEKATALRAQGPRKALETAVDAEHITMQLASCGPRPRNVRFLVEMLREGVLDDRAAKAFLENCCQKTPARLSGVTAGRSVRP